MNSQQQHAAPPNGQNYSNPQNQSQMSVYQGNQKEENPQGPQTMTSPTSNNQYVAQNTKPTSQYTPSNGIQTGNNNTYPSNGYNTLQPQPQQQQQFQNPTLPVQPQQHPTGFNDPNNIQSNQMNVPMLSQTANNLYPNAGYPPNSNYQMQHQQHSLQTQVPNNQNPQQLQQQQQQQTQPQVIQATNPNYNNINLGQSQMVNYGASSMYQPQMRPSVAPGAINPLLQQQQQQTQQQQILNGPVPQTQSQIYVDQNGVAFQVIEYVNQGANVVANQNYMYPDQTTIMVNPQLIQPQPDNNFVQPNVNGVTNQQPQVMDQYAQYANNVTQQQQQQMILMQQQQQIEYQQKILYEQQAKLQQQQLFQQQQKLQQQQQAQPQPQIVGNGAAYQTQQPLQNGLGDTQRRITSPPISPNRRKSSNPNQNLIKHNLTQLQTMQKQMLHQQSHQNQQQSQQQQQQQQNQTVQNSTNNTTTTTPGQTKGKPQLPQTHFKDYIYENFEEMFMVENIKTNAFGLIDLYRLHPYCKYAAKKQTATYNLNYAERIKNRHPHIFYFFDASQDRTSNMMHLTFEYNFPTVANLLDRRREKKVLIPECELWAMLRGITSGLLFQQESGIHHGDLEINTVFFDDEYLLYRVYDNELINGSFDGYRGVLNGCAGAKQTFISPEMLKSISRREPPSIKLNPFVADMFALGMVMLECATLKKSAECYDLQARNIFWDRINERLSEVSHNYSSYFVSVLQRMLDIEPVTRPDWVALSPMISNENFVTILNELTKVQPIDQSAYINEKWGNPILTAPAPTVETYSYNNSNLVSNVNAGSNRMSIRRQQPIPNAPTPMNHNTSLLSTNATTTQNTNTNSVLINNGNSTNNAVNPATTSTTSATLNFMKAVQEQTQLLHNIHGTNINNGSNSISMQGTNKTLQPTMNNITPTLPTTGNLTTPSGQNTQNQSIIGTLSDFKKPTPLQFGGERENSNNTLKGLSTSQILDLKSLKNDLLNKVSLGTGVGGTGSSVKSDLKTFLASSGLNNTNNFNNGNITNGTSSLNSQYLLTNNNLDLKRRAVSPMVGHSGAGGLQQQQSQNGGTQKTNLYSSMIMEKKQFNLENHGRLSMNPSNNVDQRLMMLNNQIAETLQQSLNKTRQLR